MTNITLTYEQVRALKECAEFLKDLVNASDGDEPYTTSEILELGLKLLNDLYESGFLLRGEK
jgi:hypothetical protein